MGLALASAVSTACSGSVENDSSATTGAPSEPVAAATASAEKAVSNVAPVDAESRARLLAGDVVAAPHVDRFEPLPDLTPRRPRLVTEPEQRAELERAPITEKPNHVPSLENRATVSPEMLRKQDAYRQQLQKLQPSIDALPAEEQERKRAALKQAALGN
jgi:hypothetical protein